MKIELEHIITTIMIIFAILVFSSLYVDNPLMPYVWILFFTVSALIILAILIKITKNQEYTNSTPNIAYVLDILVIILLILEIITGIDILIIIVLILIILIAIIQLYGWLKKEE